VRRTCTTGTGASGRCGSRRRTSSGQHDVARDQHARAARSRAAPHCAAPLAGPAADAWYSKPWSRTTAARRGCGRRRSPGLERLASASKSGCGRPSTRS
jgi:hypothetical protein